MAELKETGLCFYHGKNEKLFLSTGSKKYINKYKKMADDFPNDVKIVYENTDGSICVEMPAECFVPPRMKQKRKMTDEQRLKAAERMRRAKEMKKL